MAHFYQCFEEYCSLRTEESKLVGYWANEIGSKINQYVHLWEYGKLFSYLLFARVTIVRVSFFSCL